jgi:hypothetical protein
MKGKSLSFFSPKALLLLYHTVKYLRWQQVFYRLYYPFKRQIYFYIKNKSSFKPDVYFPSGSPFYVYSNDKDLYIPASQTFTFLHQTHGFESKINWRFEENGLLWSFHLHYFDWLNDDQISVESNLGSICQYIKNLDVSRGDFVAEYNSIAEASRKTSVPEHEIRETAKGKSRGLRGFLWEYKDPKKAEKLFNDAAAKGNADAQRNLEMLRKG